MCKTKNPTKKHELEVKVKTYKTNLMKLRRTSMANYYNNIFL